MIRWNTHSGAVFSMDFFCIDPSPFLCVLISFSSGGFSLTLNPHNCFKSYNLLEWYVASFEESVPCFDLWHLVGFHIWADSGSADNGFLIWCKFKAAFVIHSKDDMYWYVTLIFNLPTLKVYDSLAWKGFLNYFESIVNSRTSMTKKILDTNNAHESQNKPKDHTEELRETTHPRRAFGSASRSNAWPGESVPSAETWATTGNYAVGKALNLYLYLSISTTLFALYSTRCYLPLNTQINHPQSDSEAQ